MINTKIKEIYPSISGEAGSGFAQGSPCVFVRFAGCNLRCTWCDTISSWTTKGSATMTTMEIVKEVERVAISKNVLITGGDPLLQTKAFVALCVALAAKGFCIQVETGGQLPLPEVLNSGRNLKKFFSKEELEYLTEGEGVTWQLYEGFEEIGFVVDFKLPASGEMAKMKADNFRTFVDYVHGTAKSSLHIKFVCDDKDDLNYALGVMTGRVSGFSFLKQCERIFFLFSPTPELPMAELYQMVSERAASIGVAHYPIIFSQQIHKLISMP